MELAVCPEEEAAIRNAIATRDGTEALELVHEAVDELAVAIEQRAERRDIFAIEPGFGASPCAAFDEFGAHGIAVVGATGAQDVPVATAAQRIIGWGPA